MTAVPSWFGPALLTVLGLLVGSFGNVVIYRLPRNESLSSPPSHCPSCGHAIRWYHNVPVIGWIALRGACADCGEPISARYPIVEAATGALWLWAALRYDMQPPVLPAIVLLTLLLWLSLIDLDVMRLPNKLVGLLAGSGLLLALVSRFTPFAAMPLMPAEATGLIGDPLVSALLGVALGVGVSLGIALLYASVRKAEGFGMGDVKLLGAIGIFVGPYVLMVLFVASVLGALWTIPAARLKGWKAKVPFGPFIAGATLVVLVIGEGLWAWYAGVAGLV